MTVSSEIRAKLLKVASEAAEGTVGEVEDGQIIAGSRKVDFAETGPSWWEYGIVVSVPAGPDAGDMLDELILPVKHAIEKERSLGGLAVDCRVSRVVGPNTNGQGRSWIEYVVQVLQDEEV